MNHSMRKHLTYFPSVLMVILEEIECHLRRSSIYDITGPAVRLEKLGHGRWHERGYRRSRYRRRDRRRCRCRDRRRCIYIERHIIIYWRELPGPYDKVPGVRPAM